MNLQDSSGSVFVSESLESFAGNGLRVLKELGVFTGGIRLFAAMGILEGTFEGIAKMKWVEKTNDVYSTRNFTMG